MSRPIKDNVDLHFVVRIGLVKTVEQPPYTRIGVIKKL